MSETSQTFLENPLSPSAYSFMDELQDTPSIFTQYPLNLSETSQTFMENTISFYQTGAGVDDPQEGPSSSFWTPLQVNGEAPDLKNAIVLVENSRRTGGD
ncbi:uncharacterized protein [Parasteatoda tepidariorum]|uniref:uncharacterized protein isoform X2 n=1 Tax=Parasteatoda tepidariorum TaxID=114398 RepID=UPI0039BC8A85